LSGERNKLLILGEMRELGECSELEHSALIRYLRDLKVDFVICLGKPFEKAIKGTGFLYFESPGELFRYLTEHPVKDHYILIKGSRANQLEKIIPYL